MAGIIDKKSWQRLFSRLIGALIPGWTDDKEFDNVIYALNDIEERKLGRGGTQPMVGDLQIITANAGLLLKHADNKLMAVISDADGISITFNAYYDKTNAVWNRLDTSLPAERLYLTSDWLIRYTAPAGANPITWTESWKIKNDGSHNLKQYVEFYQDYRTDALSIAAATWTTVNSLTLTTTGNEIIRIDAWGVLSATQSAGMQAAIYRGTTLLCQVYPPLNAPPNRFYHLSYIDTAPPAGSTTYSVQVYMGAAGSAGNRNLIVERKAPKGGL